MKGHVDSESLGRALRYAVEHKHIEERQRFLCDASRALADSLEYETSLECAAGLPVPLLADACLVVLARDDHSPPHVVVHDVDPDREPQLLERADHLGGDGLAGLGFAAWLSVPLAAHGRTLGGMWLLRAPGRPGFSREDRELVEELALRCALALENARLHHELQEAVRLRDEVLAATSHDLRSPLSGIALQCSVLQRLLRADPAAPDAPLHERVLRRLQEIDAVVARSLALIQELLDAASLQAGHQLQLERRAVDLITLAERVVADHQARTERHTIEVKVADGPVLGEWDPLRLTRVLDNLLSNARKYSPRGGAITVTLARDRDADGDWAILRVEDHGVGIPTAEVGRVFDRFYRGTNVPQRVRGTGIGLSGVRQVVEQHGGSIEVESQEGVGSAFTVRLPLA